MKEIEYGDVFKIRTKVGKGFFQYVKDLPEDQCQIIRILPGVHRLGRRIELQNLVEKKEDYFVHFKIKEALKKRNIKLVGNYQVPEGVIVPRYYRYKHILQGEFLSWHIINIETQQIRPVVYLSDKEKKLSPANIWNEQLLAERIAKGWKPENWE